MRPYARLVSHSSLGNPPTMATLGQECVTLVPTSQGYQGVG